MKGTLHTDVLMHEVVQPQTGLRTAQRISHAYLLDVPTYHKPLILTDCAINIYPTLEDKVSICQNAIDLAHALGLARPKVAILSAVETVNPKITATLEAAALCKMADRDQITGGLLDGPLAMDNAISKTAAEVKHIRSEVAGDADILVVPDLEAGNMLAKQLDPHGPRGRRGHRPRRPRTDRPDQPRRQRPDPSGLLRRRPCCAQPPSNSRGLQKGLGAVLAVRNGAHLPKREAHLLELQEAGVFTLASAESRCSVRCVRERRGGGVLFCRPRSAAAGSCLIVSCAAATATTTVHREPVRSHVYPLPLDNVLAQTMTLMQKKGWAVKRAGKSF